MSCAPYVWQYCWKEISAVAYIFYLVHCLLRHEITLHVLCRDKYSTSMQQFCHPGNNSYKQEPYSFQAYMHTKGDGPNQTLNNAPLFAAVRHYFKPRRNTPELLPNPQDFSGISVTSPSPITPPRRARGAQLSRDLESKHFEQTSQVPQQAGKVWRAVRRSTCVAYC